MTELADVLKEKIRKNGPLTFRDFMEQALYHPQMGYYTAGGSQLGRGGDFYTSVHVSYLFGAMVARQLAEMYRCLDAPGQFFVTEFGAGDGRLAQDILEWLSRHEQSCYHALNYRIVEVSPQLQQRQQAQLQGHSEKVCWVRRQELSRQAPVRGVVITNELVDAFPVHLLRRVGEGLQEAWVKLDDQGDLSRHWGELSRDYSAYFQLLDWQPQLGQTFEVNLAALDWLALVNKMLKQGFVITIDYGYQLEELADPRFLDGTLLCYHRHQMVDNPLVNVGEQDITSHANFSALAAAGEKMSLYKTGLMQQSKFLLNLGIMEAVEEISGQDAEEGYKQVLAAKKLAFPGGMGEVFRVLIQHKGVSAPELRCLVPFYKQKRR